LKRIAVTVQWLIEWGGGIDLARHIIQGLVETNNNIYIFIPEKEQPGRNLFDKALRVLKRNMQYLAVKDLEAETHFAEFKNKVTIVHYRRNALQSTIDKFKIDVALPCVRLPSISGQCEWVGYIPDCQHRHLSHLFTKREIQQRDRLFQNMVNTKKIILVNSIHTKKDLMAFYDADPDQVHNLPFCPTAELEWLKNQHVQLKAYSLPNKYFMVSNQLWKHKDHITAFKALALLANADIHIVCSGKMDDYRDLAYVDSLIKGVADLGLSGRVHFLGFIPKSEQIEILKNSLAIIQPTLFEGGPGGGCVYDAIAVGTPCILSNIEINKEVIGQNIFYFQTGQAGDLAQALERFLSLNIIKPSITELHQAHTKSLLLRTDSLDQLIFKAAI
jgi:glycosyltransferase involved in cell wall biosynthesis